jgi:23S rRNA pseudouridine955/2504/2580 synthase
MPSNSKPGGVSIVTVDSHREGQRIDNFLSAQLKGVPRSLVYRIIRTGQVRINGKRCKPATRLSEGDQVRIPPAKTREQGVADISGKVRELVKSSILYQDADLLVLNKPAGMAVHGGSGLPWGLIDVLRQERPGGFIELVHRLDRETSGCLVLALNGNALQSISGQFRDGKVDKRYLCLLDGRLPQELVDVKAPLARVQAGPRRLVEVSEEGKSAHTRFRLLQAYTGCSYVEAELLTGRTHQIRAHAKHLGMPLAGDDKYASRESVRAWRKLGLKSLFLHCHRLVLENSRGEQQEFDAPLPDGLRAVLDSLE